MELALAITAALLGAAVLFHAYEARQWRFERTQLLDRLMSRSWGEYVAGTRVVDQEETPQLTTDEAEQAWYEAQQREMVEAS